MQSDIVIVGAGLVGAPLSLVLSRCGYSVVLIDREVSPSTASNNPLHQQSTALSLNTQLWFAAHGLWTELASDATAIEKVHVSQRGYFGATRLIASELGVDAVGYVVNNHRMLGTFKTMLKDSDVQHFTGTEVRRVIVDEGSEPSLVTVQATKEGASFDVQARLLIAADGVTSIVRESLGIAQQHTDYSQVGVLGSVELSDHHQNVAYERFTDSGPLAMLPRGSHHMSFVECVGQQDSARLEALNDEAYGAHLQSRFGSRLGIIKRVGPRYFTPLVRIEARRQVAERSLLLGNAARLLHPIAGQGYNLAIRDIEGLLSLLDVQSLVDPGASSLLQAFIARRQKDQQSVVRMTDLLARSFRGSASLPAHARSLGLIGLDAFTPLKQGFARHSMGLG